MPHVRFEPTTRTFERAKTGQALDGATTVVSHGCFYSIELFVFLML
jgi:hypothetical protein